MTTSNDNLVYSTTGGSICPKCRQPADTCKCVSYQSQLSNSGEISIRRDKKGRRGKTVSIISGLSLTEKALLKMASELKRKCGSGGSVKNGEILIQGDRCQELLQVLEKEGYKVKISGE